MCGWSWMEYPRSQVSFLPGLLSRYCSLTQVIREHIYRVHEAPLRCRVCGQKFPNGHEDAYTTHQSTCCEEQRLLPPLKGMTADMKIKIRDRHKHGQNPSEYDKWFDIYRILFPNARFPPSPCKWYSLIASSKLTLTNIRPR
jgi:hypothetical protein